LRLLDRRDILFAHFGRSFPRKRKRWRKKRKRKRKEMEKWARRKEKRERKEETEKKSLDLGYRGGMGKGPRRKTKMTKG